MKKVTLLNFNFYFTSNPNKLIGDEFKKRKCALGYTRVDYGNTNLSGTWIFVQLDLPNISTTSFVGVFIPDKASDPDEGLGDDDIRVVTENSDGVSCLITGMYTDWK